MELDELRQHADAFRARLEEMQGYLGLEEKRKELASVEDEAAQPGFWDDPDRAQKRIAHSKSLRSVIEPCDALAQKLEDVDVMLELAEGEDEGEERHTALADAERLLHELETSFRKLELQSLLSGPMDSKNAYVSIHAGAGGTESCDWADMLCRMYMRYFERHDYKVQTLHYQPGDEAGLKGATLLVEGPYAYGYLKAERGCHRLVRISPFDSAGRRHTSFAALDVMPEFDEDIDVEIEDKDLRVDTYRSSGAGGQHVNTTDSAVRIVHEPTGTVVQCQAERSQHKNRAVAMKMLKAKLYEMEEDQKRKDIEKLYGQKGEIAWGHQIRSYVMQPYTMVKDHRTHVQVGNVQGVLDGDLDEFIEAYLKKKQQESA
ncbi:peptide chain release factor 2 [Kiritimatiella glycovorans]|uniref:Peptide chain release factor 2 n=1 Tax=Kiritimatiella glycovorans TaxID=1307763 RepID=A0A0G3EMW1_9BACT|nr:peptide chain release factor 2 [Kiritimatiella glycovorans]AKJ65459.1 Peptide chain release factor 2 [Kiritimatiella glycovorans]